MISNEHEKSAEEEKFEIDIRNYNVRCRLCLETFPGDSEYENHKCSQKFKINPFENFKEKMEEAEKSRPFLGAMEITVAKNFDVVYERLFRLENELKRLSEFALVRNPFKCPVCQGSGGVKHPLTGLLAPAACHACEGKGIVWG